jgi:hypothetical protein
MANFSSLNQPLMCGTTANALRATIMSVHGYLLGRYPNCTIQLMDKANYKMKVVLILVMIS